MPRSIYHLNRCEKLQQLASLILPTCFLVLGFLFSVGVFADTKRNDSIPQLQNAVVDNTLTERIPHEVDDDFDIEELTSLIPSGIYFFDSVASSAKSREDCPADGYFVWNTQDRSRPVFEMGLVFEFPGKSEVTVVQRDDNGDISLSTQSMNLIPLKQTTTVSTVANDGIELEMAGADTGFKKTKCRYLRG